MFKQRKKFLKLWFLTIISIVFVFQSCKKDISDIGINHFPDADGVKAVSVSDARNWFETKYGKSHTIRNGSQNGAENTGGITISPIWDSFRIARYLRNGQTLVVPVSPIQYFDTSSTSGYACVFYRDSLNQIQSKLQIFIPDSTYARTNPNFSVNNFSGGFVQMGMDGRLGNIILVRNGLKIASGVLDTTRRSSFRPDECYSFGCSWWSWLWGHLVDMGGSIANWFTDTSGGASPPTGGGGSGGVITFGGGSSVIDWGNAGINETGGGGSGNSTNFPLADDIDNSLFDADGGNARRLYFDNLYVGTGGKLSDDEFLVLYSNKRLFTRVNSFASSRGVDAFAITVVREVLASYQLENLSSINAANEYYGIMSSYLRVLTEDPSVAQLYQQLEQCDIAGGTPDINDLIKDLIKEALVEAIAELSGLPELDRLVDEIMERGWKKALSFGTAKAIGKIVSNRFPAVSIYNFLKNMKTGYDKGMKVYDAMKPLLDFDGRVYTAIRNAINSTGGKFFSRVRWSRDPNNSLFGHIHLDPKGNVQGVLDKIAESFGQQWENHPNPGFPNTKRLNLWPCCRITRFEYYPSSNTTGWPVY